MIVGIGVDLVDIARFERTLLRTPRLVERLFSPGERSLKPRSLAARYAAKEALIKALGGSEGVHWTEIEVSPEASGRPWFTLTGSTASAVVERGITSLHLSMSHDAGLATAYVVAEAVDTPGRVVDAAPSAVSAPVTASAPGPATATAPGSVPGSGVAAGPGSVPGSGVAAASRSVLSPAPAAATAPAGAAAPPTAAPAGGDRACGDEPRDAEGLAAEAVSRDSPDGAVTDTGER